jgi:ABC-type transport system involved in multi-copper enzyme maturation permease subunit
MIWLSWRQLRAQVIVVAGALLASAVVLIPTGRHLAAVPDPTTTSAFLQTLRLFGTALIGLPALLGAFWGAPLVARELEHRTQLLAWSQSISRGRWLATKLAIAMLPAALLTATLSLLVSWWSQPLDHVGSRIGTANFGQRGFVPIAYTLFAVALGTLCGLVARRTLPAMATTLGGFFVARFTIQLLRPHLLATTTVDVPTFTDPPGGWVLASRTVDSTGNSYPQSGSIDEALAKACNITRADPADALTTCAQRLGVHDVVTMHGPDKFWILQTYESVIFVALAAAMIATSFWWLQHRTS